MRRFRWVRPTIGLWGVLTVALLWGCGRDRVNPVDPNFSGNEALSPPTKLKAEGDIGRITLTWDPIVSADLAGYGIWRSTSSTSGYVRLSGEVADTMVTTARTAFVDTTLNLKTAKVYFYKVNTVDVLGRSSELSTVVSAEALEDTRPPSAPSSLSVVTDEQTGYVTLAWTAPQADANNQLLTGLNGYRVFRAKGTQDAFVLIATVSSGKTTYTDSTSLELDARYYYAVSATDGIGNESGRSTAASITTTGTGIAAPTGLRTTGKIGEVEVSWTAVSEPELIGYLVLRSVSSQAAFQPVTSDTLFTTAQTVYADSNVVTDQVYLYRVQAVVMDPLRGLVRSEASAFVDGVATADKVAPAAPSGLIVSLDQTDVKKINLSWTAPAKDSDGGDLTGLAAFRIYRAVAPNSQSFVPLKEVAATQMTYQDTDVVPLTSYLYKVSAVDAVGNESAMSVTASVTTRGLAVPANVRATAGPQEIALTWSANTEVELTGYRVLRYASASDAQAQATFTTVQTTYVDSPLTVGQTYVYRVQAVGSGGLESELSAIVSATAESRLLAPRSVTATGGLRRVTVSWAANTESELTGYQVLRYTDPSDATPQATFKTIQTTYVDSPLTAGQVVVYRVKALGAGGIESQASQFATAEAQSLSTPRNVTATGGVRRVTVTWTANTESELTGYKVLRYANASDASPLATFTTIQTTYVDSPLTAGQIYVYRVKAVGSGSLESASSQFATAEVKSLSAPQNVTATGGIKRVTVSWAKNTEFELTGYQVLRYANASDTTPSATFSTGLTTYVDSPLVVGQTYVYRVKAVGSGGLESDLSSFASAVVSKDGSAPATPGAFSGSLKGSTTIELRWTAPTKDESGGELTGLSKFRIYRAKGSTTAGYAVVADADSNRTVYEDTGLELSSTYYYRMSARDASGNESAQTSAITVTTLASTTVDKPTNLTATVVTNPSLLVRLSWTAPAQYSSFLIQRETVASGSSGQGNFVTIQLSNSSTTFDDTNVTSGNVYIYRVRTNLNNEFSDPSESVTVVP